MSQSKAGRSARVSGDLQPSTYHALLLLVLVLPVASCKDSRDAFLQFPDGARSQSVPSDPGKYVLLFDGYLGDVGLKQPLNRIAAMAVSRDGVLAVYDPTECSIIGIDIDRRSERYRFGHCGAGPEEFENVSALAFREDDLLVYDAADRTLHEVDTLGDAIRDVPLAIFDGGDVSGIQTLAVVDDTTLFMALAVYPVQTSGLRRNEGVVAYVRYPSGDLVERTLSPPPAVAKNPLNMTRFVYACVGGLPGKRWVAGLSWWLFEEWVMSPRSQQASWSQYEPLGWTGPRPAEHLGDAGFEPSSVAGKPACGDSTILFRHAHTPFHEGKQTFVGGRVEVRRSDGELLLAANADSTIPLLFFPGAAWYGDRVFIALGRAEIPRIAVMRLRPRSSPSEPVLTGFPMGMP